MRLEKDYLGEEKIPDTAYYGINTARARRIYDVSGQRWPRVFIRSLAQVKRAALLTLKEMGELEGKKADALLTAVHLLEMGDLDEHMVVDPLQGGAGTATNLNACEVITNKALEIMGYELGRYDIIHPIDDVNRYQSTNDVFPTAARLAVIYDLKELEAAIEGLQNALQEKERQFAGMVKVGRTELQAAVPVSLGMEFGAFAEAIARDRWRIFKSTERIKVVNIGGTAVGTGITAPRSYIFRVIDNLRRVTGLGIARAENLVDATSNNDPFSEISGIMRSHAVNLIKIGNDLRFLSSDVCGEIKLKPLIRGSSIMPGKVNPVMPEMMVQAGIRVLGHDTAIAQAAAEGNLELNPFLPLITFTMLESLELLTRVDQKVTRYCIRDLEADTARMKENLCRSSALLTALVSRIGYQKAEEIGVYMEKEGIDIWEANRRLKFMDEDTLEQLLTPGNLLKLGEAGENGRS